MNVAKIHRKLMITESQFYYANISATKAQIFMKFYVVVKYYIVILSFKFHDNLCINVRARAVNVRARAVNVRAHDLSRVRAFTTSARAFMNGSL